ncbi:MAG: YncE family protein [Burkholderiales bacterium]|nr:YncE family protein [Burkholderiales bacterium]
MGPATEFVPRRRVVLGLLGGLLASVGGWYSTVLQSRDAAPSLPLEHVGDFKLPGGVSRWDYLSFDPLRSVVYAAHLGDDAIVVFDAKHKSVRRVVENLSRVHGTLYVPELDRLYVTATGSREVVALNPKTLDVVARVPAGLYPDGMAYAPEVNKLYVSDEYGRAAIVINAGTNKVLTSIALGGSAGNSQYDTGARQILVNVQSKGVLAVIDPSTDKIVERIPLDGADGNHGLLVIPERRLALIACDGNDRLLALDLRSRRLLNTFSVGHDPDVLAYDAQLGYVYVVGEAGVMSVFQIGARGITKIGEGTVGPDGHSVAVDPLSHEIYVPLTKLNGSPTMRVMRPAALASPSNHQPPSDE